MLSFYVTRMAYPAVGKLQVIDPYGNIKMAKLILSMDGLVLKEIALDKERITVGRKPYNDIQIDNLAISGEHAVIVTILDDSFLEDLNSTNGTFVNGQPVRKCILQEGDVIELGKYRLKYFTETVKQAARAGFDVAAPLSLAGIQILTGANAGKELELTKNLTRLGRPDAQVAVITRRPHGYFLTHVEGDHYPVVNGKTLEAQSHPLADHDVIELAGVKMEFFLKG